VARRACGINHFFMLEEMMAGGSGSLDNHLDRNVTMIDPRKTEERIEQSLASTKTPDEAQRALERYHGARRRERRNVPLVEDFPLVPDEETPDFIHLAMTLRLRAMHAYEHWNGNTHLTLTKLIHPLVEQGAFGEPG
jgi:hypothetical protein